MKKTICTVLCIICILSIAAFANASEEYRCYHVDVAMDFSTVLLDCQTLFAEKTGMSLEDVQQLDYTWSGSSRHLVLSQYPENPVNPKNSMWDITIKAFDESGICYYLAYACDMSDPSFSHGPYDCVYRTYVPKTDGSSEPLKDYYDKHFTGTDEAARALEAEKGPYFLWSYQDKAAFYDQWGIEPFIRDLYITGFPEYECCFEPEENDMPYDVVIPMARQAVADTFQVPEDLMDAFYEDVRFCCMKIFDEEPHWVIRYWAYIDCGGVQFWEPFFLVSITRELPV